MRNRALYMIGGLLLVAFAAFSLTSFNEALTPYVSYADARTADRAVQVAGALYQTTSTYDSTREALFFSLEDTKTGETLPVRYHGAKPANFNEAVSIVAIGRFDEQEQILVADKLLVKCPSKYQGAEIEEKAYG